MDSKYLEQSAEELLEKFKLSTAVNFWEIQLLKELLALRDAEILSKFHIDNQRVEQELKDTLPPKDEAVTLIENLLE